MRQRITVLLIVLAVCTLVTGCAAPAPEAAPAVVTKEVVKEVVVTKEVPKEVIVTQQVEVEKARPQMTMWVDHVFYVKSTEGLLKSYALDWARQAGVDLEYNQDTDPIMYPRIDAGIESKNLADVMLLNLSWLPKFQKAGLIYDSTDLVNELNTNMGGFTEGALASISTSDGKHLATPFLASTEMAFIRQDLLDAKGLQVPDTWEDVLKTAIAINNPPEIWGWGPQVAEFDGERHRTSMIWAYGGSIMDKDGKIITLDSKATRDMIQVIKTAWDQGAVPKEIVTWDSAGNNKGYQSGQVAMIENTGSVAQWLKDNDQELFNNTIFKVFPAGPAGRFIQGDVWVLLVPTTSKHPELAQDLVRYLSQPKQAEELMVAMGGFRIPVYKDLSKLEMWNNRQLRPLADAAPFTVMPGYPGPVTATALETFKQNVIAKMMLRVLSDKWEPDRAIAEAVSTIERIQKDVE